MSIQMSLSSNQLPSTAYPANRRQLQERRRTLQTISELSAVDQTSSKTKTSAKPEYTRRPSYSGSIVSDEQVPNLRRRQSLPGYCSNPGCSNAQAVYTRDVIQYSKSKQSIPDTDANVQQGYNATKERVRFQKEHLGPDKNVMNDSLNITPRRARLPSRSASLPYLRPYASQPQLSHNNYPGGGFSRHIETRASPGSFGRSVYGNNLLEGANTNLSLYHVSRGDTPQWSRYGTLSPSVPYHQTHPMPDQRYYTNPAASYNQLIPWKPATPVKASNVAVRRSSSLPAVRVGHMRDMPYKHRQAMPRSFKLPDEERVVNVQHERLAALAALTGSDVRSLQKKRTSTPTTMTVPTYTSSTSSRQRKRSSIRNRTRFSPNVRVVPLNDTLKSKSSDNLLNHHNAPQRSRVRASLEVLGAPRRKGTGERQTEKKKPKRSVNVMQRPEMADRVKWANEREQERERELESIRKGSEAGTETGTETSEDKPEKRGCLRGILAVFRKKSKG